MPAYRYVNYRWDDAYAASLDPLGRLVYRSNLLGGDQRITNTGGGNTSTKVESRDPINGRAVDVLWVKGSGGDLRTAARDHFVGLALPKVEELAGVYSHRPDRGLKSLAEDDMISLYPYCSYALTGRAPSIDTPLHAFLPGRYVDHLHPNAIIAIAATANSRELTREIFGVEMGWVPWMRPGFELGLAMREIARKDPQVLAIMMAQHGFIAWADDDKECYSKSLDWIERASAYIEEKYSERGGDNAAFGGAKYRALEPKTRRETFAAILPWLRGQVSRRRRMISTIHDDAQIQLFVNSVDAPRLAELGTSCPDHFLRTKIEPLYVDWDPQSGDVADLKRRLEKGLDEYRTDYAAYYERHKGSDSPPMRDPNPTVILVPGLGLIAWGRDKSESRVTAEFYISTIEVMRGAEALDRYVGLPQREAFDIEYWALEEAKLKRMPAEKELARQVVVVLGAGSGIGREAAIRLARDGAHVACVDLDWDLAQATANAIVAEQGRGIGVAGTGCCSCGPAIGLAANITDRASVRRALEDVILSYGGLDSVCVTAAVVVPGDAQGRIPDEKWSLTFGINVTGSYIVADEAARIWREQGLRGSLVLTSSANAVVAKRGSFAYDTSKAALNHLVRELAIELAPLVRVNGIAPATVVQGSAMFPRERVVSSLIKYRIDYSEAESSDDLRTKLSRFYADRTLTGSPISPGDVAAAYVLLVGGNLSRTTGHIIPVDGGLVDAFLR